MRSSSNTAKVVVSGMTEVEAGNLLSRLRHMQKVGLLSKETSVERTDTAPTDEGVRLRTYGGL